MSDLRINHALATDQHAVVRVDGVLDRRSVSYARGEIEPLLKDGPKRVSLDLSSVTRIDSAGAALLGRMATSARASEVELNLDQASEPVKQTLRMLRVAEETPPVEDEDGQVVHAVVGKKGVAWLSSMMQFIVLTADTVVLSFAGARRTRRVRKGLFGVEAVRLGMGTAPLLGMLSFVIGAVLAAETYDMLATYGATDFIAEISVVTIVRELGPTLTASIVASRAGSAIAAEVATMQVQEENDALHSMGLNPTAFAIVPKFQALVMTVPALTVYTTALGVLGAFLVATAALGIDAAVFFSRAATVLTFQDMTSSLLKSVAFGAIVVLVAAHQGAKAIGGARAVATVTTKAVVLCIFWVIMADAFISVLFLH